MAKFLKAALAAGLILAATSAYAETASGTIQSWDDNANTITLTDGGVYHLGASVDREGLTAGRDVTITYTVANGKNEATTIEMHK